MPTQIVQQVAGPIYAKAVTASDVTVARYNALYVITTGNLTLTPKNPDGTEGTDIVLTGVPVGFLVPFVVSKVKAASTAVVVNLA